MDYLDRVYKYILGLKPGRYPLDKLMERDRFIEAVKELIDGEWIKDAEFSSDYFYLVIKKPFNDSQNNKNEKIRKNSPGNSV